MLRLVRVRMNAGSRLSPSVIGVGQVHETRKSEQSDSLVVALCEERDVLNQAMSIHLPTSKRPENAYGDKSGRWTVIDESNTEVEL